MKFPAFIDGLFGFFILGICLSAPAQTNAGVAHQDAILTALGWQLASDEHLAGATLSSSELTNLLGGFSLGMQHHPLPLDMRAISPDVDALARDRQKGVIAAIKSRNLAAAEDFLKRWEEDGRVTRLPDGVCFEIVQAGSGVPAQPAQTVRVHYVARLINGTVVTEFGPDDVILVTNHLNGGLFEGFRKVGPGGKMKLYLPPELAEEQVQMAGASPGSALVYEVEVLGSRDTPPDDLAAAQLPAAPDPPPPAYSGQFPADEVIEAWGWKIAERNRIWQANLNEKESAEVLTGMEMAIRGQSLPFDTEKMRPMVAAFIDERREEFRLAFKQKQIAAMNALFSQLDKDNGVVKLPDGLRYKILKPGSGPFPHLKQTVLVNYVASTLDGHVFDQTAHEPLHVDVGSVMPGWNEGIQKIGVGGKIRLYIPPSLGYGGDAVSGVPADSTLIYDIELAGIVDTAQ